RAGRAGGAAGAVRLCPHGRPQRALPLLPAGAAHGRGLLPAGGGAPGRRAVGAASAGAAGSGRGGRRRPGGGGFPPGALPGLGLGVGSRAYNLIVADVTGQSDRQRKGTMLFGFGLAVAIAYWVLALAPRWRL